MRWKRAIAGSREAGPRQDSAYRGRRGMSVKLPRDRLPPAWRRAPRRLGLDEIAGDRREAAPIVDPGGKKEAEIVGAQGWAALNVHVRKSKRATATARATSRVRFVLSAIGVAGLARKF